VDQVRQEDRGQRVEERAECGLQIVEIREHTVSREQECG
jgi:hypothetical protein